MSLSMPARLWLAWLAGLVTAGALGVVGALVLIYSGLYDTTASTPHVPPVAWAAHTTMRYSTRRRAAAVNAPDHFTAAQVQTGLQEYDEHCVACHGGPATSRAPFAAAMTPTPPYLLDAARKWSPAELYWIVDHGVKMTAMPAWGETEPQDHIWDIVAFLEAMPKMAPADYLRLKAAEHAEPSGNGAPGADEAAGR